MSFFQLIYNVLQLSNEFSLAGFFKSNEISVKGALGEMSVSARGSIGHRKFESLTCYCLLVCDCIALWISRIWFGGLFMVLMLWLRGRPCVTDLQEVGFVSRLSSEHISNLCYICVMQGSWNWIELTLYRPYATANFNAIPAVVLQSSLFMPSF